MKSLNMAMHIPPPVRLLPALLLLGLATACGNKGALYLEDRSQPQVAPAAVTGPDEQGRDPDEQDQSDATISASGG